MSNATTIPSRPKKEPPAKRRQYNKGLKVAAACSFVFLLMFIGYQGRRHATLQSRVEDIVLLRDQLQQKLDEQRRPPPSSIGDNTANASLPPATNPQIEALGRSLRVQLDRFSADYSQDELPEAEGLDIRLSRATLANADQRFAGALTTITDKDRLRKHASSAAETDRSARVLQVRGDAFYGLREWREALDHYRQLLVQWPHRLVTMARIADCQDALGQLDDAVATKRELAKRQRSRGNALVAQGKLEAGVLAYERAIETQTRLLEQDRMGDLLVELASTHGDEATALLIQGKTDAAVGHFAKAIEILMARSGQGDGNELARSLNHQADALLVQGKLDAAVEHYAKAIEIRTRLVEREGRAELATDLALSHSNRGNALLLQGKLDAAAEHYAKAIEIRTRLVEREGRAELATDLALIRNNRGVVHRVQGKLDAAIMDFENAITVLSRIAAQNRSEPTGFYRADTVSRPQAKLVVAIGYSDKAIEVLPRVRLIGQPGRNEERIALAVGLRNRAYAHLLAGKPAPAVDDFNQAMAIYSRLVEQDGQMDLALQYAKSLAAIAWMHAADPEDAWRDGNKAREYALKGCELTEWKTFAPIEALAAACAETGNFGEAVRWQSKALELAPRQQEPELRSRLELYKSGKPYRAPFLRAK